MTSGASLRTSRRWRHHEKLRPQWELGGLFKPVNEAAVSCDAKKPSQDLNSVFQLLQLIFIHPRYRFFSLSNSFLMFGLVSGFPNKQSLCYINFF